jgi:hypothetical protein
MIARMIVGGSGVGLLLVMVLTCRQEAVAQNQPDGQAPNRGAVPAAEGGMKCFVRAYDVSSLIINIEDRPFSDALQRMSPGNRVQGGGGGGFGGGGGGFFSVPSEADGAGRMPRGAMQRSLGRVNTKTGGMPRVQYAQIGGGGGGLGGGGGAMMGGEAADAGEAGPPSRITMADLVRVITSTVATNTWSVNGGGDAAIEPLGTSLIICQTAEVHDQIRELLRALEKVAADHRTVTIDARWLMLTSDELKDLMAPDQKGVPQVDREQLERLTRRPGSLRGVTSCLSSQLVYVVSGTMKNIVSGWIPVVGSIESPERDVQLVSETHRARIHLVADSGQAAQRGRSVGYQPIVQSMNFGALLEIRPTLTPANSEAPALVDLKSTVTIQGAGSGEEQKASSEDLAPAVDRLSVETMEFATTLRMPLKQPVLVGGLTYIPSSSADGKSGEAPAEGGEGAVAGERPQLYLVLEVR